MGDGRVDRIFCDITFHAEVIVFMTGILRQSAALILHFACGLPRTGDDLTDTAHRLGVGTHHTENTHIVQNILCGDRLRADTGIRERNVLRDVLVEVVAYHQHVKMLIKCVDSVRHCRIRGGRQNVRCSSSADDVRCVAAAGSLGVVRMDGSSADGRKRIFDASAFVQSIGVDGNLDIELIGNVEAVVNDRRRCAPVLVDFQAHRTGFDLLNQRSLVGAVALAEKTKVHRIFLCGFQHHAQIPRSRGTRRCVRAVRRAGAAADHRGHAAVEGAVNLLRADKVDVSIDAACRNDHTLAGQSLGRCADRHARSHAVHDIRVSGFSDAGDFSVFDSDVCFYNACSIHDQSVCDDKIKVSVSAAGLNGLSHTVADGFAAAEFYFIAVCGVVFFDFNHKAGVGKADLIADGRTVHSGIFTSGNFYTHFCCPSLQKSF